MKWKCVFSDVDVVCYQGKARSYEGRIEARLNGNTWKIYKTYYDTEDISLTDTFEAQSREEMERIIKNLQAIKDPTLEELRHRMVQSSKELSINLERVFKDYNVEKWQFTVNDEKQKQFVYIHYADNITIDVIIHESMQRIEKEITTKLLRVLGVQPNEEEVQLLLHYFASRKKKEVVEQPQTFVVSQFDTDWKGSDQ